MRRKGQQKKKRVDKDEMIASVDVLTDLFLNNQHRDRKEKSAFLELLRFT
jgi:hypothetical protein